jgi:hypothetical protein
VEGKRDQEVDDYIGGGVLKKKIKISSSGNTLHTSQSPGEENIPRAE